MTSHSPPYSLVSKIIRGGLFGGICECYIESYDDVLAPVRDSGRTVFFQNLNTRYIGDFAQSRQHIRIVLTSCLGEVERLSFALRRNTLTTSKTFLVQVFVRTPRCLTAPTYSCLIGPHYLYVCNILTITIKSDKYFIRPLFKNSTRLIFFTIIYSSFCEIDWRSYTGH